MDSLSYVQGSVGDREVILPCIIRCGSRLKSSLIWTSWLNSLRVLQTLQVTPHESQHLQGTVYSVDSNFQEEMDTLVGNKGLRQAMCRMLECCFMKTQQRPPASCISPAGSHKVGPRAEPSLLLPCFSMISKVISSQRRCRYDFSPD